mmetsp:Transcript_43914/g.77405  ORF Transcript_43914/g.77405 Transcript_43914/m.77405 type:complete len:240 (-) Transcript_43914:292-1011(-)
MLNCGWVCTQSCRILRLWNQTVRASESMPTRSAMARSWSSVGVGQILYAAANSFNCSTEAPLSKRTGGGRGGAESSLQGRANGEETPTARIFNFRRAAICCSGAARFLESTTSEGEGSCFDCVARDMRQSTTLSVDWEDSRCTCNSPAAAAARAGESGKSGRGGGGIAWPSAMLFVSTLAAASDSKERVLHEYGGVTSSSPSTRKNTRSMLVAVICAATQPGVSGPEERFRMRRSVRRG